MASNDSVIRLVNLFELLVNATHPLTMDEIYRALPDLPDGEAARRQAIERAKASLKTLGYPIRTEFSQDRGQVGYLIRREDFYLEVSLDPDEEWALGYALGSVVTDPSASRSTTEKLGLLADPSSGISVGLNVDPRVASLLSAIAQRAKITFTYLDRQRLVAPYGLLFKWGRWYLVASYDASLELRTFRVDRMESDVLVTDELFVKPQGLDLRSALPDSPVQVRVDEGDRVVVRCDSYGRHELYGVVEVTEEHSVEGGLVDCVFESFNTDAVLGVLLPLENHGVIVDPKRLRERAVEWLSAMMEPIGDLGNVDFDAVEDGSWSVANTAKPNVSSAAAVRKFRLLEQMLPYLGQVGSAKLSELSKRVGVPPSEVIALLESAATCGLPPYSPEMLYEIVVSPEEDLVEVRLDTQLGVRKRLDYLDAVLFRMAYRILRPVLGDSSPPLDRAYDKVSTAMGAYLSALDDVEVDVGAPEFLAQLRDGAEEEQTLRIEYSSAHSGSVTERLVDPYGVFYFESNWYLRAREHGSGKTAIFRVSRIINVSSTGQRFNRPRSLQFDLSSPFDFDGDAIEVVLVVDSVGLVVLEQWVPRMFSILGVSKELTKVQVLAYSQRWLGELLLRLGPHGSPLDVETQQLRRSTASALVSLYC